MNKKIMKEYELLCKRVLEIRMLISEEGLMALEKNINYTLAAKRDVLEYGLCLINAGFENKEIKKILSNVAALEKNKTRRLINEAKKETILHIWDHSYLLYRRVNSYFDIPLEEKYNRVV
jgi:hypothetical protein